MFGSISKMFSKAVRFVKSLDTGALIKIGAGVAMLGGGIAIAMAASDDDTMLLEEGPTVRELSEAEVTIEDISDEENPEEGTDE
jgi:hypothetical protein